MVDLALNKPFVFSMEITLARNGPQNRVDTKDCTTEKMNPVNTTCVHTKCTC